MGGKPIVYMAHPEDFFPSRFVVPKWKPRLRDFFPSKVHGINARYLLGQRDEYKIYKMNAAFCETMKDNRHLVFSTLGKYVEEL